ncbi:ABC transporter ATP-binding protein [Paenibacillus sacheonensis]|uniref:ATP-binding cassette domain-containing protein n=1 Tax=Paenibacillus sacheonensis TaxID=742054 RepID=A0A7X4YPR4_9BACL|nr:ATP-binding cassette domain-containing protein [Paenibacillus sacheonensis]MBM7564931.1 ABC-2 type transport system ATP-binding protein [Paenibacillus sacheonensis]NBC70280.1 ATP-binding cassette domain-containing protein [Paenibacillus sacheonensis]
MAVIEVNHLIRDFKIGGGGGGSLRLLHRLLGRSKTLKRVVDDISFTIEEGDFVGYLGPNGAGKSTTIKMLSGVLVPTAGIVRVLGLEPFRHRKANAGSIGVVFGQRTQLWWDLPLRDSFKLLGAVYRVEPERLQRNIALFTELLDMGGFLDTPVRQLSLGQRMRGDIAASLLHDPKILFLDEPTIGLDIVAKENIQQFLKQINREKKVTVILTTHNLDDIERLCKRVIFIDKGRVLFDGSAEGMTERFGGQRYLVLDTEHFDERTWDGPPIARREDNQLWFSIHDDKEIASMVAAASERVAVHNLTVKEPRIEDIIKQLYALGEA